MQGRPPARPAIGEVAYEWFIDMREKKRARVTPEMVTAKVAVAADAIRSRPETAGEVETLYNDEGCQDFVEMRRWVVGQWLKQRNLSLKIKSQPFKLSEGETTRRLGAF